MEESKEYMNTTAIDTTTNHMVNEPTIDNINNISTAFRIKKRDPMSEREETEEIPTTIQFIKYQNHDTHDDIKIFEQLLNRTLRCTAFIASLAARECSLLDPESVGAELNVRIAYTADLAHANRLHPPDLVDPESVVAASDVG